MMWCFSWWAILISVQGHLMNDEEKPKACTAWPYEFISAVLWKIENRNTWVKKYKLCKILRNFLKIRNDISSELFTADKSAMSPTYKQNTQTKLYRLELHCRHQKEEKKKRSTQRLPSWIFLKLTCFVLKDTVTPLSTLNGCSKLSLLSSPYSVA